MSNSLLKYKRYGGFRPFDRQIEPIMSSLTETPMSYLAVSDAWVPAINGAIGALARDETWKTDNPEVTYDMISTAHEIMSSWGTYPIPPRVPNWRAYITGTGLIDMGGQRGQGLSGPFYIFSGVFLGHVNIKFVMEQGGAFCGGYLSYFSVTVIGNGPTLITTTNCVDNVQVEQPVDIYVANPGEYKEFDCQVWNYSLESTFGYVRFVIKNDWTCGNI